MGKSHLIRWLALHTSGNRHVILIPKSTSLRRIIENILKGLAGPGYDEIRKQLATAHETLDDIAAEELLLAHFRTALRRRTNEARGTCDAAVKRNEKPDAKLRAIAETHGDGLIALLEGPTKDALLRDNPKRTSVFSALVRRVTTGIIDAEHGQFTPDDFEFAAVTVNKLPDPRLQKYVAKLKSNTQNDRATAAELMNEVRDGAVGQLLGLGENQLADLFRRVREELFKDGRELVLLIEDFTTQAGVQQGLLDVIKMEGVRAGEAERCPLRTALAVTEGYLSPYDTLKTRAGYEFVLREQPAAEAEVLETLTDMVGAYLNTARLGPDRLKDWFDGTDRNPDAKPPSFGASEDDAAALRRKLGKRSVVLLTLHDRIAAAFRQLMRENYPDARVDVAQESSGTKRLRDLAAGADVFIVNTFDAKHAATTSASQHRPPDAPTLYPTGKNAARQLDTLEEWLRSS